MPPSDEGEEHKRIVVCGVNERGMRCEPILADERTYIRLLLRIGIKVEDEW